MALLHVSSPNNPNLSWALNKNPQTILASGKPFQKPLRKGQLYGWFTGISTFTLWFRDAPTETSFATGAKEGFEYLDYTRYGHPYLAVQMIETGLRDASVKPNEHDIPGSDGAHVQVRYLLTSTKVGLLEALQRMLPNNFLFFTTGAGNHRIMTFGETVSEALQLMVACCALLAMKEDFYFPLNQESLAKYLKIFNRIGAPYFLMHLFSTFAITTREVFESFKHEGLLGGPDKPFELQYGSTQQQRHASIKGWLSGEGLGLIDIGCGELYHSSRLASKYELVLAYDADEEQAARSTKSAAKKNLTSINVFHREVTAPWVVENTHLFDGADVLLSEVLEHMEKPDAAHLMSAIMTAGARRIVITVPNGSFNKNFPLEDPDRPRHWDHKWEPTAQEWKDFVVGLGEVTHTLLHNTNEGDRVGDDAVFFVTVFEAKTAVSE